MYKILLFIALAFSSNTLFAATFEVEMLNRLGKESMVYSENIVNVKAINKSLLIAFFYICNRVRLNLNKHSNEEVFSIANFRNCSLGL